ncbi:MAG: LysE family translocator [Pseudomonadota bacterium]
MFDPAILVAFFLTSAAIVIVPGPTVSVIIANSLRRGAAAGLMNVAGTQAGLITMIAVLAVGLEAVVSMVGEAFVVIKLIGAAYLVYLGIKMLRSDGALARAEGDERSLWGYFAQGFFVIWSNPKALLFFGAFIPQFVSPAYNSAVQVVVYGLIFMLAATVFDSIYALLAGRAGRWLTSARVRIAERIGGCVLVAGGVALAFTRR